MMDDSEIDALAKGMVPFVRECVTEALTKAVAPINDRLNQIEGRPVPDAGAIIRDALTAERHKGGIDVLAPADVAQEMLNAVSMLAEPFPVKAAETNGRPAVPKPRSFRFERDAQNRIVAAFEEIEG
jgi:hypothetical protein